MKLNVHQIKKEANTKILIVFLIFVNKN
jgi:hypothetical protein